MADPATNFKLQQFRQAYPSLVHYTCEEIRSFYPEIPKEVWDEFERNALKAPAIVKGDENATIQEYKVSVENWLVAESNKFIQRNENELGYYVEVDDDSGKPAYIPYSYIVKYLAEIIGIGDADDFAERVAKINRFFDNEEIRTNIQILGNRAKGNSLSKMNKWDIFGDTEKSLDFWRRLENDFKKSLKSLNLDEFKTEAELIEAMSKKNYVAEVYPEYKKIKKEAEEAMKLFSKKGQKIPFKEFDKQMVDPFVGKSLDEVMDMYNKGIIANKNPRLGIKNATLKFNRLQKVLDVLTNAKLNAILGLLFTPTPLYEKTPADIRKENMKDWDYKFIDLGE